MEEPEAETDMLREPEVEAEQETEAETGVTAALDKGVGPPAKAEGAKTERGIG